jgi:hypothetical protein
MWVRGLGERATVRSRPLGPDDLAEFSGNMETHWGPVTYLRPAVSLSNTEVAWQRPPSPLGSDRPAFD